MRDGLGHHKALTFCALKLTMDIILGYTASATAELRCSKASCSPLLLFNSAYPLVRAVLGISAKIAPRTLSH